MTGILKRLQTRLAMRGRIARAFTGLPEPRTIGNSNRGDSLTNGQFLFGGHLVAQTDGRLWDIKSPDSEFDDDRHGFTWLDDLAAHGSLGAQRLARTWTGQWIEKFGDGSGPGWRPGLTGRRVSRLISHSVAITDGTGAFLKDALLASLSSQTHLLARKQKNASQGLPQFEALGGLIQGSLFLEGMQKYLDYALRELASACQLQISEEGAIHSRNPQELMEIFAILTWAAGALSESGRIAQREHLRAIECIAPVLRGLRHSDGALARFHGGGRGELGRLEQALASSGQKRAPHHHVAMGFARLSGGRTSVILDAAPPPTGSLSTNAHASTLALELTSGRRPIVVNCGSGLVFGQAWHKAGRSTPSHSTLCIEANSSSTFARILGSNGRSPEILSKGPKDVPVSFEEDEKERALTARHDGYERLFGLIHSRHCRLSYDGRRLSGEDEVAALTPKLRKIYDRNRKSTSGGSPAPFAIRFHLHPDVEVHSDHSRVILTLKSGEVWVFSAQGATGVSIEPSIYLEKGRLEPRNAQQILLTGHVVDYSARISWAFSKSAETPDGLRDLEGLEMAETADDLDT